MGALPRPQVSMAMIGKSWANSLPPCSKSLTLVRLSFPLCFSVTPLKRKLESPPQSGMPHSHHSHSGQFCKHASGLLEEVVHAAVQQGFELYGLTEHVPRYREEDMYPEEVRLLASLQHSCLIRRNDSEANPWMS